MALMRELLNRADYIPDEPEPADAPRSPQKTATEAPEWLQAEWRDEDDDNVRGGGFVLIERLHIGSIADDMFGVRTEIITACSEGWQ